MTHRRINETKISQTKHGSSGEGHGEKAISWH